MLKTNSKQAKENIRASIQEYIDDRMNDESFDGLSHSAWNMNNIFIAELWHDIAKFGRSAGFRDWVQGLSFGDFINAKEEVAAWLEETPEEADKYSHEQAEELYLSLLEREFAALVERPKEGIAYEVFPYLTNSEYRATLRVYQDDKLFADVSNLDPVAAIYTGQWLEATVRETGELPYLVDDVNLRLDDPSHDYEVPGIAVTPEMRAVFQRSDYLQDFASYGYPVLRKLSSLARDFLEGRINDDAFYPQIDRLYAGLRNDIDSRRCAFQVYFAVDQAYERDWEKINDELLFREPGNSAKPETSSQNKDEQEKQVAPVPEGMTEIKVGERVAQQPSQAPVTPAQNNEAARKSAKSQAHDTPTETKTRRR